MGDEAVNIKYWIPEGVIEIHDDKVVVVTYGAVIVIKCKEVTVEEYGRADFYRKILGEHSLG